MPTYQRLTKAAMKAAKPGAVIREHDIIFERLPNEDGKFSINPRVEGKRIHRTIGLESKGVTKESVEMILEKLKTDARASRFGLPKGRKYHISFKSAAIEYQEMLKQTDGKNLKRKEEQFRLHLIPFFGSNTINSITTYDIERYKSSRKRAEASNGTINRELAVLSHFYSKAKEWGWLDAKPFIIKKMPEKATRITYLTPDQSKKLMKIAKERHRELYLFLRIGLSTGMRMGEIFSIKLENLDLNHQRLFIPEGKTGSRNQPLTLEVTEYLRFYIQSYCTQPKQVWLFPSKKSRTGHRTSIRKAFRAAVIAAGLDPAKVVRHTMRHTVVSWLIQAGVDIHTVMDITGHKTQEMVLRYSHRDGQHIQTAMDKLQGAMNF